VTNIPGPQFRLYVLGRQLEDLFPLAFLPKNHALAVAIMSYNGGIDYGLLADYDALPDIDVIAAGIDASLRELLEAVPRAGRPAAPSEPPRASTDDSARNGRSARILPTAGARPKRGPAADMRAKRAPRSGTSRKDPPS